jgi:hypothetical protein
MLRTVAILSLTTALAANVAAQSTAGHCLAFDDLDDFVRVPRSPALEPQEITLEMWARLDGLQDWNSRLLRKGEFAAYFLTADTDLDRRMQILVTQNQPGVLVTAKDTQTHDAYVGTWHHFLGIYTADRAEFWVDGRQRASKSHTLGPLTHDPLIDLYIGAGLPVTMPNEYFGGRIDEVRIWNYARTPAEIAATWNRTASGNEAGLVARWSFDEGSGQVAHDSTAFAHHGQLGATSGPESSDPLWLDSDAPLLPGDCTVTPYCLSAVNSTGKGAHIGWQGSTVVTENEFVLLAADCPPHSVGLFFMGSFQTQIPFGEGWLCITGNQQRLLPGVLTDASGATSYALDFEDPLASASLIEPGSAWNFQLWYRDPQPVAHGFNLTDALHVQFCP